MCLRITTPSGSEKDAHHLIWVRKSDKPRIELCREILSQAGSWEMSVPMSSRSWCFGVRIWGLSERRQTSKKRERERVTNKHPSDSSLQTLKRGGLVSPFRVWLSGEKVWFASGSVTTEVHVYSFFLFVEITISRLGSILSGPVACPWATICATLTL